MSINIESAKISGMSSVELGIRVDDGGLEVGNNSPCN